MNWIERQRQAAPDDLDPIPELLDRIENWQSKAREEAEKHRAAATKKAVQNQPPGAQSAKAMFGLFATEAETIYHVAREELSRASETDALELEDILMEAYPLFMRAMVRYDPERGPLNLYLAHALRQRIRDYITSHSHETSDDEQEVEDTDMIAPGFDIPALYSNLVNEGKTSAGAARLYDRLHPDR